MVGEGTSENQGNFVLSEQLDLSVVIPTYNESGNILNLIGSIHEQVPSAEVIVVDDNSPDGTGKIVKDYVQSMQIMSTSDQQSTLSNYSRVNLVSRSGKNGLISAILEGVRSSASEYLLIMDADFSHPPEIIPKLIGELQKRKCDIVVASRYIKGGSVIGWPLKRRLISEGATKLAQYLLGIRKVKDPMSGFFAIRRRVIQDTKINNIGYKILLEILVRAKQVRVSEIPYTFVNRKTGESKFDSKIIFDYIKAVWLLYRNGR